MVAKPAGSKNKAQSANAVKVNSCIDWYWTTWDHNTGEILSEEYLFSTCDGGTENCQPFAIRNSKGVQSIKMLCGGGGGSGDGSGNTNDQDTTGFHRLPNVSKLPPRIGNLPQPLSTCVFMVLEYINDYIGGTATFDATTKYYASQHDMTQYQAILNGVALTDIEDLLTQFYNIQRTVSLSDAINSGTPCVGTLIDGTDGHEVMITGYKLDGTVEYFDPQDARYHQKNVNQFSYVYTILAPY